MADTAIRSLEPGSGGTNAVRLGVPPDPTMSRVARLAVSGLASLAGCTVDEIEDLKIAVSEILIALIEHGDGGRVDLEFELVADDERAAHGGAADQPVFVVRGRSPVASFDLDHADLVLCRTVLDSVCSQADILLSEGFAEIVAVVRVAGSGRGEADVRA